jgi:ATP-dependent DNA helicase RecG
MLFDLQWQARGRTVDETPVCHADLSVLKHQDIIRCLSKRFTSQSKLNVTQLKALGLLYEENQQIWPNVAGVLLFSQYPQHYKSEAMVICTRFKGISGREILASQDCEGSLFEQIELAFHFVSTQLNISSSIRGLKRDDVMEMPMIALREGIVNAVVHRHYGIASPIKIAVYDNRVEIFSPGCFPGPINQKQIELGVTYVRNRIIVNLMREAGAVEKLGSGLMTIFSSFEKAGLAEPELKEGEAFVKLVLPRYNIQKSVTAAERIVDIISKEGPKSISELLERFSESKSTVTRRVNELIHSNRLKKIGNTRNTVYSVVDE